MSFPIGTRGEDVRDIATDVAERFFQTDEGYFDYIAGATMTAITPCASGAEPPVSGGRVLFLGRNHRFNYDDFRLAMVEEAEKYGAPGSHAGWIAGQDTPIDPRGLCGERRGRAPRERERVGGRPDPDAGGDRQYQNCLLFACREACGSREDIAAALFRAGEVLESNWRTGGPNGDVYMAEIKAWGSQKPLWRVRAGAGHDRRSLTRNVLCWKRLIEIQTQVQHMQPLGLRSSRCRDPSEGGIHSEANIDASQRARASPT